MGHLINTIAFRLGINKSWENTWYIKNLYYAEYLHNILNLKNFVYYIFTRKQSIKNGIFLSEFFFFKYNKYLVINIFIYYLDLEKTSYIFINKIYESYFSVINENRRNVSPTFWFLHNADLFALIYMFYHLFIKLIYFSKIKEYVIIKNIINFINNYKGKDKDKYNQYLEYKLKSFKQFKDFKEKKSIKKSKLNFNLYTKVKSIADKYNKFILAKFKGNKKKN